MRPFTFEDAAGVQRLAGDPAIADVTLNIPHPYEDGIAEAWIGTHKQVFEEGQGVVFAVALAASDELVGCISLTGISSRFRRAEMGYWMGKPYWNRGYASEAARALIGYAFQDLGLHRVFATHLVRNPASGRVMQKAGMTYEGTLREHAGKEGRLEDLALYGILRHEWGPQDPVPASAASLPTRT